MKLLALLLTPLEINTTPTWLPVLAGAIAGGFASVIRDMFAPKSSLLLFFGVSCLLFWFVFAVAIFLWKLNAKNQAKTSQQSQQNEDGGFPHGVNQK